MITPLRNARPAEILLVEDNLDDVLLTRMGFERAGAPVNLHHVENGEECLAFLRKQGIHGEAPTPDLILLDLNMPIMDGREVLSEMNADPALRQIPVVVLTTSADEQDLQDLYRLRCNSYIVKPVDFDQFQAAIEALCHYWFSIAALPTRA